MKRFKRILLVARRKSDNEALIARAVARAKRNGAALTVADVLREPGVFSLYDSHAMSVPDLRERMIEERRSELQKIVERAEGEGVEASARVLFGVPFVEIIRAVIRDRYDLVMIAAEGRRELKEMLFGRTSMQLMRKCPCPVWVFKPSQHHAHDRILAAIDPMPYDDTLDELNRHILDLAFALAELDSADLYVVHAWAWLKDLGETKTLALESIDDETLMSEMRRIGRECIGRLLDRYKAKNARVTVHTLEGSPEEMLPVFARDREADLIVMGTVCRTGLDGFFMGSTAERVLRYADCSVLTVKPDDFVSPVTVA